MSTCAPRTSEGTTYRLLRELGSRTQPSYAAIRDPHHLVVTQTFVRASSARPAKNGYVIASSGARARSLDAAAMAILLRDAHCLAKNWHPNVARVRYVDLVANELTVATELLDGMTLADLFVLADVERTSPGERWLALPLLVRILLDVLAGLHALHGLRDGIHAPLGVIHGELSPANIVVGRDGVARIIDVLRPRPVLVATASDLVGYAAPESLDANGTNDPRADVYAVGVVLWEALAGHRLYDQIEPAAVLSRQREGDITPPRLYPSSPFAPLADVAMRATAFEPALRFRGAAEMAAEIRRVVGSRLAPGTAVALRVADLGGERLRARRLHLEAATSETRRRASERAIATADVAIDRRRDHDPTSMDANGAGERTSRPTPIPVSRVAPSRVVPARPRVVLPTIPAEVPAFLLAASRASVVDDEEVEDDDAIEELDVDDALIEDDFPGPDAGLARSDASLLRAEATPPRTDTRPWALDRQAAPEPEVVTPIPLGKGHPFEGSTPPRRHGGAVLLLMATVALLAAGTSFAMRASAVRASAASEPTESQQLSTAATRSTAATTTEPPGAAAPATDTSSTTETSAASAPTPAVLAPAAALGGEETAPAQSNGLAAAAVPDVPSAAPSPVTSPRPVAASITRVAAPATPPATKPKRSIYDPNGL